MTDFRVDDGVFDWVWKIGGALGAAAAFVWAVTLGRVFKRLIALEELFQEHESKLLSHQIDEARFRQEDKDQARVERQQDVKNAIEPVMQLVRVQYEQLAHQISDLRADLRANRHDKHEGTWRETNE